MPPEREAGPLPAHPCAERRPPGRGKIMAALRELLAQKDFNAVTIVEIARTAGVTEALIYKYFKDKRDLLYQVLGEYLGRYRTYVEDELAGIEGAFNRLRRLIGVHVHVYATDRVFAKILLLEVRSYSDYYTSAPYDLVKRYGEILLEILERGAAQGEIRRDLPPWFLRQVILGCIENVCLTRVAFDREISRDLLTEDLCAFIFQGLAPTVGAVQ